MPPNAKEATGPNFPPGPDDGGTRLLHSDGRHKRLDQWLAYGFDSAVQRIK